MMIIKNINNNDNNNNKSNNNININNDDNNNKKNGNKGKKEVNKKLKGYDYYVPFTENSINFITQNENKEIFIFENKKIKYKGNSFNNYNPEKFYI